MSDGKKLDVNEIIEQTGAGSITSSDIMEVLEDIDYDIEQMEKIYESLESNGVGDGDAQPFGDGGDAEVESF